MAEIAIWGLLSPDSDQASDATDFAPDFSKRVSALLGFRLQL